MNPETKQIVISRDVTFLYKLYGDWENVKYSANVPLAAVVTDTIDEDNELDALWSWTWQQKKHWWWLWWHNQDDNFQIPVPSVLKHGMNIIDDYALHKSANHMGLEEYDVGSDENEVSMQPMSETTINTKVIKAIKNLEAFYHPKASKMVAEAKSGNELLPMSKSSAMALSVVMELVKSRTFQQACPSIQNRPWIGDRQSERNL